MLGGSFICEAIFRAASRVALQHAKDVARRVTACLAIQRAWRMHVTHGRTVSAALKLHSWVRHRLCRGYLARGWISWQIFVDCVRAEEEGKWLGLQAKRGWLAAQVRAEAVITIQRVWRGARGRNIVCHILRDRALARQRQRVGQRHARK